MLNKRLSGLYVCRQKASGVGGECSPSDSESCMSNLRCRRFIDRWWLYWHICDKGGLRLGQKCNPRAKKAEDQCQLSTYSDNPMDCLPKNDGNRCACQIVSEVYDACHHRKNIGCSKDHKLICSKFGTCIPRK